MSADGVNTRHGSETTSRAKLAMSFRDSGETLKEIGGRFGISGERARQLIKAGFIHLPPEDRPQALDEAMAPYLIAVPSRVRCRSCGTTPKIGELLRCSLCKKCRSHLKAIENVCTMLRRYQRTNDRISLINACTTIRKHDLRPEELSKGLDKFLDTNPTQPSDKSERMAKP